jgi:hypothetical protein
MVEDANGNAVCVLRGDFEFGRGIVAHVVSDVLLPAYPIQEGAKKVPC